ncbi:uncharacterized protein [Watersipora subatra]|uniref:uncharacterized protein n=1 Tax=Watersipora subatra TaxID=2589382 RepID=UPI00355C0BC1
MGDFPYLEFLTRSYLLKARTSGHWKHYLQAHGLANYCFSYDPSDDRQRLVYEIEKCWYRNEHPLNYEEFQKLINEHKRLLEDYRRMTKTDFENLNSFVENFDIDDPFSETNLTHAKQFSDKLFHVNGLCSKNFVKLSQKIIKCSYQLVKQRGYQAPCKFSAIALGSVAKGEATPYSDLEYAFIVEENDGYFEKLAVDTYFRIGNLGESPLKSFDIEELESSHNLHMRENISVKPGYRIDGITKSSGNIPTGNGRDDGQRLTFTLDELKKLCVKSAEAPFDEFPGDKSDMLSSSILLFTNESNADNDFLLSAFTQARHDYECTEASQSEIVITKRFKTFAHDMRKYSFLPEFIRYQPPQNRDIKVKSDIFRYPTLLANNLKMCLRLKTNSSWEHYDCLHQQGVLSDDNHMYLNIILALSIYIRTASYFKEGCQTESIQVDPKINPDAVTRYYVPVNLFVLLGCLLIPVKQSIESALGQIEKCSTRSVFQNASAELVIKAVSVSRENLLPKIQVLYFTGHYQKAKYDLCKVVGKPIEKASYSEFCQCIESLTTKCSTLATPPASTSTTPTEGPSTHRKYSELCAYILYYTHCYDRAVEYFNQFLIASPEQQGLWRLCIAHCHQKMGDLKTAKSFVDEAKVDLKSLSNPSDQSLTDVLSLAFGPNCKHEDAPTTYINIGWLFQCLSDYNEALDNYLMALKLDVACRGQNCDSSIASDYQYIGMAYRERGEYEKSLEYLTKSLAMQQAIYGANANHSSIASSYSNMGLVYSDLGEYETSLEYHTKSLAIEQAIYGANANHSSIASSYSNMGIVYSDLGKYKKSLEYHTKSLDIEQAIYGANANHSSIASSYSNIGIVYTDLGEYEKSLEYHKKSLAMEQALYGANANHSDIACSYSNIGLAYSDLCMYEKSLECHKKSLAMEQAVYGANTNHSSIACSYSNIGSVYKDLGKYEKSLEHHTKSLAMEQAIYVTNDHHSDIACSYSNIGEVYNEIGEYEKSLEYHEKALIMYQAVYGADAHNLPIANNYHGYAETYQGMGEYSKALDYCSKALTMYQQVLGADTNHRDIAKCLSTFGEVYSMVGEYEKALQHHTQSLDMYQEVYGSDASHVHVDIARCYKRFGDGYKRLGQYSKALCYFENSQKMYKVIFGINSAHPKILELNTAIANVGVTKE